LEELVAGQILVLVGSFRCFEAAGVVIIAKPHLPTSSIPTIASSSSDEMADLATNLADLFLVGSYLESDDLSFGGFHRFGVVRIEITVLLCCFGNYSCLRIA